MLDTIPPPCPCCTPTDIATRNQYSATAGHVPHIGCAQRGRIAPPMTPYGIDLSKGLHAQADTYMRSNGGYCAHGAGAKWGRVPHPDHINAFTHKTLVKTACKAGFDTELVNNSGDNTTVRLRKAGAA